MLARTIVSRSICCTGSAQSCHERGHFCDHIGWTGQKEVVTRTRPSQHACPGDAPFERARLAFGHCFIEAIECGVRCRGPRVVRAGKNGQRRESNLGELAATRRDCLTSRCLPARLTPFGLGKSERSASDRGWCGRWTGKAREVF